MLVGICGARGSVPSPGADMVRYGGNTSCVHITLSDGTHLVLDAGTGIRNLELEGAPRIHILLTHLHLDHIQGLLFFSPLFQEESDITIWGPSAPGISLRNRIGRYLSAPLTPVEVRELPCHLDFRNCPVTEWRIGSARVRAETVTHRGPTLGFRIEDDAGGSLCYLPDHEPAIIGPIEDLDPEWISGHSLARRCDLLLHDSQYTDEEYPAHLGWGHSSVSQALTFADRSDAAHTLLFHHDPQKTDDDLDAIFAATVERWRDMGRDPAALGMAVEGARMRLEGRVAGEPAGVTMLG